MLDLGWQELFVIAALALIVIGPKDLPRTLKTVAGVVRKARGMAREFRSGLDDMIREAELDEIKTSVKEQIDVGEVGDIRRDLESAMAEDDDDFDAIESPKTRTETAEITDETPKSSPEAASETPADGDDKAAEKTNG